MEKKLAAGIHAARSSHIHARIELHRQVNNIPIGASASESAARLEEIRIVGQAYQGTLSEYNQAVEAYTKFVLEETAPDDAER